jgi:membrane associated rhomboid family serine protease/ribosomal protein L40E
MAQPELSVVCRKCGSEVSPYVTECPYCGNRLRKRAPQLEREGGEIRVREGRREKRLRRDAERRAQSDERRTKASRRMPRAEELATKPVATVALVLVPAVIYVLTQAAVLEPADFAIVGPPGDEPWRYLSAPFGVFDTGYLFVAGLGIAIFGPALERRIGSVATGILGLACGVLGMLAAVGVDAAIGDDFPIAAGPNAIALGFLAAYVAIREPERRADPEDSYDVIAVGVAALVLLALPIVEPFADPWAGVAGALVGGACGWSATMGRRGSAA